MSPPPNLVALARAIASQHALDPALVCAIVEQESSWDTHAIRYEPAFRAHYVAPLGLSPTEEVARSISWGLMQVMGQSARERGFNGKFLSALCDPSNGLAIGCAVLACKTRASLGRHPARPRALERRIKPKLSFRSPRPPGKLLNTVIEKRESKAVAFSCAIPRYVRFGSSRPSSVPIVKFAPEAP